MSRNQGLIRELNITLSGSRPVLLRSGSSIPTDSNYSTRFYLAVQNLATQVASGAAWLGGPTVTPQTGYQLPAGTSINTFPGSSIGIGDLYAVTDNPGSGSGGGFVTFVELRILEA